MSLVKGPRCLSRLHITFESREFHNFMDSLVICVVVAVSAVPRYWRKISSYNGGGCSEVIPEKFLPSGFSFAFWGVKSYDGGSAI
jgi:hypothetical protein